MRKLIALIVFAGTLAALTETLAAGPASVRPSSELCLACHGNLTFSTKLADGEPLSLYIDRQVFARSVHGGKLACTDCHSDISAIPHAARKFKDRRAASLADYELCKQCHFTEYSRLLDGVHYASLAKGNQDAPTCVDCHGSHAVAQPAQPRSTVSRTCAKCHKDIAAAYLKSVHGKALIEEDNHDVPVCTDCHHPHDNADPLSTAQHLRIPELCARCHTNGEMMAKYGISTQVLTTYLNDFHGMTASLRRSEKASPAKLTATCTDCHGVHNITRVDGAGSGVIEANLLTTCRRCHATAGPNFPSAWLGHYQPGAKHASLVYAVKIFYMIFIPFVIGGLVLQILLHLWRVVVNR